MKIATLLSLMEFRVFRGRMGEEDRLAVEWATRLRAYTLEGRLAGCWTHLANEVGGGGRLAAIRYALAKAMGLIAGSPDYVFTKHDKSIWVEMKTPTGRLSPNQKAFAEWATSHGVDCVTIRSLDEGDKLLIDKGFLIL